MKKPVKLGLIGAGWIGRHHGINIARNPAATLAAVCDISEDNVAKLRQETGQDFAVFKDHQKLLASDIDAVVIASPNGAHAAMCRDAAQARKHIYCEKPMAITLDDCRRVREAVEKAGVKYLIGYHRRLNPLYQYALGLLREGKLGQAFMVESDYLHHIPGNWDIWSWLGKENVAGSLFHAGSGHNVDLIRFFCGDITEVACIKNICLPRAQQVETEDTAVAIFRFASGAIGKVQFCVGPITPFQFNFRLYGTKGSVLNNRVWFDSIPAFADPGHEQDCVELPASWIPDNVQGGIAEPWNKLMDHFIDMLANNAPCLNDVVGAYKTSVACFAAMESAKTGSVVSISELEQERRPTMNQRERFVAVATAGNPDYVPIFGFPGAHGMSGGALKWTHRRLIETGMPAWVGGSYEDWVCKDPESWHRYWGTAEPLHLDFELARGVRGIKSTTRIENGFEIVEYESGAIERQVIDNANHYAMPEFVRYTIRDRASWEFWRDRMTPTAKMSAEEMEANCRRFDRRDRPLFIGVWGAYGVMRSNLGPEGLSLAFYDDPELVHDMMRWQTDRVNEYVLPLIERLKPECVFMGEDLCYNHGMLLSPAHFREFCGPYYQMVWDCANAAVVPVRAVDSDGNVMEFVDTAVPYGLNCLYPFEVKAGNDLLALRRKHPRFIGVGWLEKEIINEGNEHLIEPELMRKVPPLLAQGRYFPNGDHGIQPGATFAGLCRFMTLLHELCRNPEGEFPRR